MKTPLFYHGRSPINTDINFIKNRLTAIPEHFHERVGDKYTHLFLSNGGQGRRVANTWLHKLAVKFRNKRQ